MRAGPLVVLGDGIYAASLGAALQARGSAVVVRAAADVRREGCAGLVAPRPAALVLDLMAARRDDFALLRLLRAEPGLRGVPLIVSAQGTPGGDLGTLDRQLTALGATPLLDPHDVEAILDIADAHQKRVA
ncbi:MAG TPA: hypothetical protein VFL91_27145 [Thermomicrobiales bacterium]|nr:hypothetical protein [Thermomicrobiales bacterium]